MVTRKETSMVHLVYITSVFLTAGDMPNDPPDNEPTPPTLGGGNN